MTISDNLILQDWTGQAVGASIIRNFDCRAPLVADTIIAIVSVTASLSYGGAATDLTLTGQAIDTTGKIVSFLCSGGSYLPTNQPQPYFVRLIVTTLAGETLVMTSKLMIQPT